MTNNESTEIAIRNTMNWDIPMILRSVGALALIISLSSFLFQGWSDTDNDIVRYTFLLGETLLIGIAGVLSIKWLNDPRGARTFIGLVLVAIPINFAIIGGLIYALTISELGINENIPAFLHWQSADTSAVAMISTLSVLLLLPMTVIAYRILANKASNTLSGMFILTNIAMLIPLRDGIGFAVLLFTLTTLILWKLHSLHNHFYLQTPSGQFSRITLFIPLIIMFGRSLWIYGAEALTLFAISISVYLIVRHISQYVVGKWKSYLNIISLIPAIMAIFNGSDLIVAFLKIENNITIPIQALAFSGILWDTATRSPQSSNYQRMAVIITLGTAVYSMLVFDTIFNTSWVIMSGLVALTTGFSRQQRLIFLLGLAATSTGFIYQMYHLVHHFDVNHWWVMATIGVLTILTGSIIERHGAQLKYRVSDGWKKFCHWNS